MLVFVHLLPSYKFSKVTIICIVHIYVSQGTNFIYLYRLGSYASISLSLLVPLSSIPQVIHKKHNISPCTIVTLLSCDNFLSCKIIKINQANCENVILSPSILKVNRSIRCNIFLEDKAKNELDMTSCAHSFLSYSVVI